MVLDMTYRWSWQTWWAKESISSWGTSITQLTLSTRRSLQVGYISRYEHQHQLSSIVGQYIHQVQTCYIHKSYVSLTNVYSSDGIHRLGFYVVVGRGLQHLFSPSYVTDIGATRKLYGNGMLHDHMTKWDHKLNHLQLQEHIEMHWNVHICVVRY